MGPESPNHGFPIRRTYRVPLSLSSPVTLAFFLFLETVKLVSTPGPLHLLDILSAWVFSPSGSFPSLGFSSKVPLQRSLP